MEPIQVKMLKAPYTPKYKSEFASGADIYANVDKKIILKPQQCMAVPTGLFLEIPVGFEGQVRSRSGLALNDQVVVLNSPGTIDSDYRGEIKVILMNFSQNDFTIEPGDRIAQIVFAQVVQAKFDVVDQLHKSERGAGGFGHTGTKQ